MSSSSSRTMRPLCSSIVSPRLYVSSLQRLPFPTSSAIPSQLRQVSSQSSESTSSISAAPYKLKTPSQTQGAINGPSTTHPPALETPTRAPGQSFFPGYAFALGKSYLTFYKTGVKAIYRNFQDSRPIQKQLDEKFHGSLSAAIESGYLDRSKFQLITRSWFDVKRVPAFGLVFMICGEFTPLIVIAVTNIVPYVCRIPKQVQSDRKQLEDRRNTSFRNLTSDLPKIEGVGALDRMQLLHISWSLGLSGKMWDYLGGRLPGLPDFMLRSKVDRRVKYLEMDDQLILRDGGVREMNAPEIERACVERGINVLGQKDENLRQTLRAWLRSKEKWTVEKLLLTRPAVWPSQKTK